MNDILTQLGALLGQARAIENPSPYVGGLIGALNAAKDNATWEIDRQALEVKKDAKES